MAYLVLIKNYKSGGTSSKVVDTPSVRSDYKREFGKFTANYRYTESAEEAEKIKTDSMEVV